ncbi:MAG: DUF5060 domain-containing protein [Pseudomonadota bacterium]
MRLTLRSKRLTGVRLLFVLLCSFGLAACETTPWEWERVHGTGEQPVARHEAGLVAYQGRLFLLGGRRVNPVNIFDPATGEWSTGAESPLELHHFQPVVFDDHILLIGAMTGAYPTEQPVGKVIRYRPQEDRFEWGHEIPMSRRRGGAGVVFHDGYFYIVGGITNGHVGGSVPWLDRYDPATGLWEVLPDAPHSRDHIQVEVVDDKLFVFGGRRTSQGTGNVLNLTESAGDVFDLQNQSWVETGAAFEIPTMRAGQSVVAWQDEIVVIGGESATQQLAHDEVEAFNVTDETWRTWPRLGRGRHGTGAAIIGDYLYTLGGSGERGGSPELIDIERLKLPHSEPSKPTQRQTRSHQTWAPIVLQFRGPVTSETDDVNPFLDYRLLVTFSSGESQFVIRGFYAADGDSANTSASAGDTWQVNFHPPHNGKWEYSASLRSGHEIALAVAAGAGVDVPVEDATGVVWVNRSDTMPTDKRARGALTIENGYFRFANQENVSIKRGANSPENLLAYSDFDATYRRTSQTRDGEARATTAVHRFASHKADWRAEDTSWGEGRGKSLIGAMNYLASQGMNSQYFLTMNIAGDGDDVWPYVDADTRDRFDCSRLAQWDLVFSHMQRLGVMLHVVLQETENELLLDGGETGRFRQLYLLEMIARFGHHPALVWNLGEENGPVPWSPNGQTTAQRMTMASFLKSRDPYDHAVLLHTHASRNDKTAILTPLLGFESIDGLSFQVDDPARVSEELRQWRQASMDAGHQWLITMDEIGPWQRGAAPDAESPDSHAQLRQDVLWGSLLAGAAGVEWYYGAQWAQNDLTSEDWRERESLWRQTNVAAELIESIFIPGLTPCLREPKLHCLQKDQDRYVLYRRANTSLALDLSGVDHWFDVRWFDPVGGGAFIATEEARVRGGGQTTLDRPPDKTKDWVAILDRM